MLKCWVAAEDSQPDIYFLLATLSLTRSPAIFSALLSCLEKQSSLGVNECLAKVFDEVDLETYKPKTLTYDTSTMSRDTITKQVEGVMAALPNFADKLRSLKAWIGIKIPDMGPFRRQHFIGNLVSLQSCHPKRALDDYIPKDMFKFVDAPEQAMSDSDGILLDVFSPLISEQNTTLVAKDFLREYSIPKRINGYLNVTEEVCATDATTSKAKRLILDAYKVLKHPSVRRDLQRTQIECAGAVLHLAREKQAFSFFMFLTNLCQACHSERDAARKAAAMGHGSMQK